VYACILQCEYSVSVNSTQWYHMSQTLQAFLCNVRIKLCVEVKRRMHWKVWWWWWTLSHHHHPHLHHLKFEFSFLSTHLSVNLSSIFIRFSSRVNNNLSLFSCAVIIFFSSSFVASLSPTSAFLFFFSNTA